MRRYPTFWLRAKLSKGNPLWVYNVDPTAPLNGNGPCTSYIDDGLGILTLFGNGVRS